MEEAALRDQLLGRHLVVEDAGAGGHPLRGAVGDEAAAAGRVVVREGAVHDVGDGLEAAVRVPGRALRLAGRVLDGAQVVEQQEGVRVRGSRRAGRRGGPGSPRPRAGVGAVTTLRTGRKVADGRVGPGDAGQGEDVVGGDCWHLFVS